MAVLARRARIGAGQKLIRPMSWLSTVLLIDGALLGALLVYRTVEASHQGLTKRLFAWIDLGGEMNVAAWWSALLLALCALQFLQLWRERRADLRAPWMILSLMFALLSLDELGSLHERTMSFSRGPKLLALTMLAALLIGGGLYAVIRLGLEKRTRLTAILIILAGGLYGSVVLQEFIEHRVTWPWWAKGVRAAIEEGTELVATLLVLTGIFSLRPTWFSAPWKELFPRLDAGITHRLLLAGLLVHLALTIFYVPHLTDLTHRGNPAAWYPFITCAALACSFAHSGRAERRQGDAALFWIFLVSSLAIGAGAERLLPTTGAFAAYYLLLATIAFAWGNRERSALPLLMAAALSPALALIGFHEARHVILGVSSYLIALGLLGDRWKSAAAAPPSSR